MGLRVCVLSGKERESVCVCVCVREKLDLLSQVTTSASFSMIQPLLA